MNSTCNPLQILLYSIVGPEVNGIWSKGSNKADINSVAVSNGGNVMAIGNDFGSVKLIDFPCKETTVCGFFIL